MKDDFMWNVADALSSMRLYVEGALVLFENDVLPLTKLAHEQEEWNAADALDTIGEALYRLREHIIHLQEVQQQTEEAVK